MTEVTLHAYLGESGPVYRRRHPEAHALSIYKMPGGVPMCWVVLAFFAFIVVVLTLEPDTLQALLVTPVWFVILGVAWYLIKGKVHTDDSHTELGAGAGV